MAFDLEGARAAGYTDAEIADYLAAQASFDLKGARSAGYSNSEVIAHLAPKAKAPGQSAAALLEQINGPGNYSGPTPEPSFGQRAVGTGEAALTLGTGAVGGTLGMIGGTLKGIAEQILSGEFGTAQAADLVEKSASEGAQALTYQPRTAEGQRQAAAVGGVMQNLMPVAGLAGEAAMLANAAGPAAAAGRQAAAAAATRARAVAAPAAQRLQQATQVLRPGEATRPTPGTMGSVGAAGTDVALQRRVAAESLPEPIRLTKGQAERTMEQQRFEMETAKDPALGAPLRERFADQNAAVPRNFEAWIEKTGAQAATDIEVGRAVDTALVKDAARAKAEYRAKYKAAEKAGEMADPVDLSPIRAYLEENASMNAPELAGGALGIAEREIARLSQDGQTLTLADMELLRRQIGNAMDANPQNATNMRAGAQLRDLIDQQTEGLGGNLYREARAARRRYAQLYEDNAIVRDLLATRRGTTDRQVALENVFRRTVLNGTREDLGKLRRTLQVTGSEEGAQAWRELQGATLRHIIDESTKGVATDVRGNPIVSAAKMNTTIRQLDQGGRLDFVLGKQGAQQIRDMNELVKVIYTSPPGAVNTSNTASVILAAIAEAGATGAISGLPIPAISTVKLLTRYVNDRQTRIRILQALGEAEKKGKKSKPAPAGERPQEATLH